MKLNKWQIVIILILAVGIYFAADYLAVFKSNIPPKPLAVVRNVFTNNSETEPPKNIDFEVKEVASGLHVPWSIGFINESTALIAQRNGEIKVLDNDKISTTLVKLPATERGEAGLMGLAIDPEFSNNNSFYVCYAYTNGSTLRDKVVRLTYQDTTAKEDKILLDNIPAANNHAGCRVKFGPDGYLYVTTGDAQDKSLAQNLDSLAGKILRMTRDGEIPKDNPFKSSYIYSYGHRNPQGITWDPVTKSMLQTEHGPSVFDGPAGGDEINHINKGQNYGWPIVSHEKSTPEAKDPLIVYTPAVAPAGAVLYSGKLFPQFERNLFFGGLKGEGLFRLEFTDESFEKVEKWEKLEDVKLGRIRDVVEAPNGEIYFTTSNQDGRGKPRAGDDKIYKLTNKQ